MFYGLLVDDLGRVRLVHSAPLECDPVAVEFSPSNGTLSLTLGNGKRSEVISGVLPDLSERLAQARDIDVKRLRSGLGGARDATVPLRVREDA